MNLVSVENWYFQTHYTNTRKTHKGALIAVETFQK